MVSYIRYTLGRDERDAAPPDCVVQLGDLSVGVQYGRCVSLTYTVATCWTRHGAPFACLEGGSGSTCATCCLVRGDTDTRWNMSYHYDKKQCGGVTVKERRTVRSHERKSVQRREFVIPIFILDLA